MIEIGLFGLARRCCPAAITRRFRFPDAAAWLPEPVPSADAKVTGQRALDGFCIANGEPYGREKGAPVAATDLHRLPIGLLDRTRGKTG